MSEVHVFHGSPLQYSDDRKGPFKLYIYGQDGYHSGGRWSRKVPKYPDPPDREIDSMCFGSRFQYMTAMGMAFAAVARKQEVRVTNGLDEIVYHAKNGVVLYPVKGRSFWQEIFNA